MSYSFNAYGHFVRCHQLFPLFPMSQFCKSNTYLTSPLANGAFINVKVFDTYPFHQPALIAGMKRAASPASQVRRHADGYGDSFSDQSNKSNNVAV